MMKQFSLFLLVLSSIACSLSIHAQSDRFVCDESCDPGSSGVAKFNVVSGITDDVYHGTMDEVNSMVK